MVAARIRPQGAIRPSRKFKPNFLFSVSGGGAVDSVARAFGALSSGATIGADRNGKNVKFDGSSGSVTFPTNDAYNITGPLTLVWVGTATDYSTYSMLITRAVANGIRNNPFELRIDQSSGNLLLTRGNGSGYTFSGSTTAVPLNVPVVVVATQSGELGNAASFYINGASTGVSTGGGTSGPATSNTEPLYLGRRADGNYQKGTTGVIAGFNRVLSAAEIAEITANPAALFESQSPMLYAAAAGGTNATASPSGVSASTAVGSVIASGQAKASPAGVSATSAVGTATGRGNAAAQPLGVSATASVGTATAQGTASSTAQPVGVAASASVGTATASGQGKASPAGVSATAAVGAATASAASSSTATPAGVSVLASIGLPVARGNATAAPAGVAAVAAVGIVVAGGTAITTAFPAGVSAVASVGVATVSASARATPAGVMAYTYVGSAIAYDGSATSLVVNIKHLYIGRQRTRAIAGQTRTRTL